MPVLLPPLLLFLSFCCFQIDFPFSNSTILLLLVVKDDTDVDGVKAFTGVVPTSRRNTNKMLEMFLLANLILFLVFHSVRWVCVCVRNQYVSLDDRLRVH